MGHGDSEGDFEDSSVKSRLSDISAAIDFLKGETGIDKIILFGIRFGATLALLASENDSMVKDVVMVAPILNGKKYIGKVLRSNLTTQLATYKKIVKTRENLIDDLKQGELVNIDGYLLNYELFKQIEEINLQSMNIKAGINHLVIQVSKLQNQKIELSLEKFYKDMIAKGRNLTVETIQNEAFWTDRNYYQSSVRPLYESFIKWFDKNNQ
jgi:esterase/lipase